MIKVHSERDEKTYINQGFSPLCVKQISRSATPLSPVQIWVAPPKKTVSLLGCRFSFLWSAIRFELRSASHRRSRIQFTYPARRSTSLLVRRRARVSSCFARIPGWHFQNKKRFASWWQRRRFIEAARLLLHIRVANASLTKLTFYAIMKPATRKVVRL